jgi:hypothetical protein
MSWIEGSNEVIHMIFHHVSYEERFIRLHTHIFGSLLAMLLSQNLHLHGKYKNILSIILKLCSGLIKLVRIFMIVLWILAKILLLCQLLQNLVAEMFICSLSLIEHNFFVKPILSACMALLTA